MRIYRLLENKDKFINRNPNLTDEQKKEIKDTLNRYSYLEGTVDWNKSDKSTYEDFKSMILDKAKTSKTSQKKQKRSMAGLTEGKDYLCLYDGEGKMKGGGREVMYVPLTWKASMILGSNHVEPKTWPDSKLMPAEDFVGGDAKVEIDPVTGKKRVWMPGAKWCVADPKKRSIGIPIWIWVQSSYTGSEFLTTRRLCLQRMTRTKRLPLNLEVVLLK